MALPQVPTSICPDLPIGVTKEWQMWTQSLGDGYETRQLSGINPLKMSWTVAYTNRPFSKLQELDDFFTTLGARACSFYDPMGKKDVAVFVDGWTLQASGRMKGGAEYYGTLSLTMRRAYGYK